MEHLKNVRIYEISNQSSFALPRNQNKRGVAKAMKDSGSWTESFGFPFDTDKKMKRNVRMERKSFENACYSEIQTQCVL